MSNEVKIKETLFGKLNDGQKVYKYTLTNKNDFEINIISYGAAIQSILTKDKTGKTVNVCLGFDSLQEYTNDELNPYFGCSIGRVANRISNAQFKLNGEVFTLDKNNGNNCLHGGKNGLSKKVWAADLIENGVKFTYLSPDGEGGFPGEAWFEAVYTLDYSVNLVTIEYKAITDKLTPINLTNHAYFNLSGRESTNIYEHHVKLFSDVYLGFNKEEHTVTGQEIQVENTKYDFREYRKLGDRIKNGGKWPDDGYDNFFVVKEKSQDRNVASVKNPSNGIRLDVCSNQNGVQFYTGNHLDSTSNTQSYSIHQGFCLETHNYPDSVNHDSFPSCILNPNDEYYNKTSFKFSIEN